MLRALRRGIFRAVGRGIRLFGQLAHRLRSYFPLHTRSVLRPDFPRRGIALRVSWPDNGGRRPPGRPVPQDGGPLSVSASRTGAPPASSRIEGGASMANGMADANNCTIPNRKAFPESLRPIRRGPSKCRKTISVSGGDEVTSLAARNHAHGRDGRRPEPGRQARLGDRQWRHRHGPQCPIGQRGRDVSVATNVWFRERIYRAGNRRFES